MSAKSFLSQHLNAVKRLIENLPNNRFDSHEFIRIFKKEFEVQYVGFLNSYDKKPFRKVHAQIAGSLSKHADYLEIGKLGKVYSKNVFGIESKNEGWVRK
ncbi:MAG: hypothetical protein WDZ45_02385 [Flavobacteriaceae bacterium]